MGSGPWPLRPFAALLPGALLFLAPRCTEGPPPSTLEVIRSDSAGVEVVTTLGEDVELAWDLEPLFSLGGDEGGPGSFFRVDASMVGADQEGRLYVLSGSRVEVFDPKGAHLRSMGREGEGPGEIAMGGALAVFPQGDVAVFDAGKRALVRFGPEGQTLSQVRLEAWPVQDGSRRLGAAGESLLVNQGRWLAEGPAEGDEMEVRLLELSPGEGDEGRVLARLERPAGVMVRFPECGGGLMRPPILSAELVWDARTDRVAWSDGAGYRVEVVASGEGRLSVRRDLLSVSVGPDLARAAVSEGMTMQFGAWAEPCHISPDEMVEGWGHAEELQWVRWVALDPEGGLWVTRREVSDGEVRERVDVFAPDGAYRGTLPLGTPSPVLALPDDRVAWVEEDALEIQRLVVGRVIQEAEDLE